MIESYRDLLVWLQPILVSTEEISEMLTSMIKKLTSRQL